MNYINLETIIEHVNVKETTKDHVVININGEALLKRIYEDLKLELKEEDCDEYDCILKFQDAPFITIHPNEVFGKRECIQILREIQNRCNTKMMNSLGVEE